MTKEIITQDYVKQLFEYRDGALYWKISLNSRSIIGKKAGSLSSKGYFRVSINGKTRYIHRLIFLMHHGYVPKIIDHKDGNSLNNKIENLRSATYFENCMNAKLSKTNTSGVKNVCWYKGRDKWHVRVSINGKEKSFGYFDDLELADLVAQEVRDKYHGKFANHG
jgi:hypothetical protein